MVCIISFGILQVLGKKFATFNITPKNNKVKIHRSILFTRACMRVQTRKCVVVIEFLCEDNS